MVPNSSFAEAMEVLVAREAYSPMMGWHAIRVGCEGGCEEEGATGAHGVQQRQAPEVDRGAPILQLGWHSTKHSDKFC